MNFHRIYYGDCLETLPQLGENSVHLIVTSPPYYNAREYSTYNSYQDYLNFMDKVISNFPKVLVNGGYLCLNSTTYTENKILYPIPFDLLSICQKYGFKLIWDVIWLKPKYTQALWRSSDYNYKKPYPFNLYLNCFHEYVWILRLGESNREISQDLLEANKIVGRQIDVKGKPKDEKVLKYSYREWELEVATPSDEGHSATFPIDLPLYCIEQFSLKNDVVLDPFLGSGTTSKAAMLLGRNSIGIEKVKEYFALIKSKMIPEQKDIYLFSSEEILKKEGVAKHTVEFKNADFMSKSSYEVFVKDKSLRMEPEKKVKETAENNKKQQKLKL